MTLLTWGDPGNRLFETGIDRGVLYVDGLAVAWSGLTSLEESPSGGEAKPYYLDGRKYLNRASAEEFEATLTAYFSPPEFDDCDGTAYFDYGFSATQQPRKPFGLSYRTLVGNDTEGTDYAYKIHMIYNALASPTQRTYGTVSDSPDVGDLSWGITTKPVPIPNGRSSSHVIFDSSKVPPLSVTTIERILYGDDNTVPRLPLPEELFDLLIPFEVTDMGDYEFRVSGPRANVTEIDPTEYKITEPRVVEIDENTYNISSD